MGRMHAREALVPGRMGMDAWMGVSASRRSRGLGASGGGGGLGASVMAVPDAVGQRAAEVERGRGRRPVSRPRLHDLHPRGGRPTPGPAPARRRDEGGRRERDQEDGEEQWQWRCQPAVRRHRRRGWHRRSMRAEASSWR